MILLIPSSTVTSLTLITLTSALYLIRSSPLQLMQLPPLFLSSALLSSSRNVPSSCFIASRHLLSSYMTGNTASWSLSEWRRQAGYFPDTSSYHSSFFCVLASLCASLLHSYLVLLLFSTSASLQIRRTSLRRERSHRHKRPAVFVSSDSVRFSSGFDGIYGYEFFADPGIFAFYETLSRVRHLQAFFHFSKA